MVYLSKEILPVIGMEMWRTLFLQHMEIAVPLLLQTALTHLLQFAVLKPSQNPSRTRIPSSLVSRNHQETVGSFVWRHLISWSAELCQGKMLSSHLSHSPCHLYLTQPVLHQIRTLQHQAWSLPNPHYC